VQRYGGRVVFTSGDVVFSSTALIRSMESSLEPAHASLLRLFEQEDVTLSAAEETLSRFRNQRVLVIGETIIDTYIMCDRPDVASESPVMTLRPIERRSFDGGAAIIARHLAAMGAEAVLLTALPRNPEADALGRRLEVEGLHIRAVPVSGALIEKQRFLVGANKVMKLDLLQPMVLDETDRHRLVGEAGDLARECTAAIVADFGQGLFTGPMLSELCRSVRPHVDVMTGDVSGRRSSLLSMRKMDLLCPSELEIRDALRNYEDGLSAVVWHLLDRTASTAALVTLGGEGLTIFEHRGGQPAADWASALRAEHVPPLTRHPIDQLGCGDALLAAATLTRAAGGSLVLAALLGSVGAAHEAQKLGNVVISASDLRQGMRRLLDAHLLWDAARM
jgi:bifunctional ADP-heptose synthase (sugar kinase/adenylyltransferase)